MIIWRMDRFSLIREVHISYDDHLAKDQDLRFRTGHVAIITELRPVIGCPVVVATTHLAWGRTDEDVRLWQLSILLAFLHRIGNENIVLCGDFNAVYGGRVHSLLSARLVSAYSGVE